MKKIFLKIVIGVVLVCILFVCFLYTNNEIGIGYLFGIYWAWGICGMWVAFALDENIRGIIFVRRWYGMKWVNKSFVRS